MATIPPLTTTTTPACGRDLADLVCQDPVALQKHLAISVAEITAGRGIPHDEVFRSLRRRLAARSPSPRP